MLRLHVTSGLKSSPIPTGEDRGLPWGVGDSASILTGATTELHLHILSYGDVTFLLLMMYLCVWISFSSQFLCLLAVETG